MSVPAYVDIARLCQELCICERTVDAHVKQGLLPPHYKLGGKRLWKWSEVERYIRHGPSETEADRIRNATRRTLAAERP